MLKQEDKEAIMSKNGYTHFKTFPGMEAWTVKDAPLSMSQAARYIHPDELAKCTTEQEILDLIDAKYKKFKALESR